MSREIVIQQAQASVPAYTFAEKQEMAKTVAASRLFPGVETPQAAMTLMLLCEADGLHPVEAMRRYHLVEGRPSMKAEVMQAEFQRAGGTVEWKKTDATEATAVFRHPKHAPEGQPFTVTLAELVESGVAKAKDKNGNLYIKKMYKQFPAQMLRARCVSQGVRAILPGIILGIYTPEEISDFEEPRERHPIEAQARVVEPAADAMGRELAGMLDGPKAVEPKRSNPRERHPAPAEVAAELAEHEASQSVAQSFRELIAGVVAGVDAEFAEWCDGNSDFKPEPVVKCFQVENHIATWAKDAGVIKPEHIEWEGKRDPKKVATTLATLHRKNPDRFLGEVAAYCERKLAEIKKRYIDAAAGPDHAAASQEVHGEGENQTIIEREEVAVG